MNNTEALPPLPAPFVMVNRYGAGASTADSDGGVFTADQMRAYAAESVRAALAAPAVPPGWQLVPVEPTPAMLQDGSMHCGMGMFGSDDEARKVYAAMLAAAPAPQQPDHNSARTT